jgi:hypothetical protein
MDESPNFMNVYFFRSENAKLWRNFDVMSTFKPIIEVLMLVCFEGMGGMHSIGMN